MEEYCWVITQAAGQWGCVRTRYGVLNLYFRCTSSNLHVTDGVCTNFRLAKFRLAWDRNYASVRERLCVWSFRKSRSIRAIHLNIFYRSDRACYVNTLHFRLRFFHLFVKSAILLRSDIKTCVAQRFYSYFYGKKFLLGVLMYSLIIKNFLALCETEMFTINPHRFKWFTLLFKPTLIHISATHIIISIVIP
jgi:hypothetical protein